MRLAREIGIIGALVTFAISPSTNLDPINLPKFVVLFVGAGYLLSNFKLIVNRYKSGTKSYKVFILTVISFVIFQFLGLFLSGESLTTQIFGVFGRNTGFLTYLALSILLLFASTLESLIQVREAVKYFVFVMLFELFYGYIQLANLDPFDWKNQYNRVIGTLGNPNFSSAMFGIAASALVPFVFQRSTRIRMRIGICFAFIAFASLTIFTRSWQGTALILFSLSLYLLVFLRTHQKTKQLSYVLLATYPAFMVLSYLGFQGQGPLGEILKKPTFAIRVDYWRAAIKMIYDHPFFGVGADHFGNWFRLVRDEETVNRIGQNVSTNSSHNLILDIMANTGLISGLLYLVMISLILLKSTLRLWNIKSLDNKLYLSVLIGWLAYQIQSLISINQIGVGVWGWIATGLMAAMVLNENNFSIEMASDGKGKKISEGKSKKSSELLDSSRPLFSRLIITPIFILIAVVPLIADAKVITALKQGNIDKLYTAVTSYPSDPSRLAFATQAFAQNKLPEYSLKTARYAVTSFPNDYVSWQLLSQVANSEAEYKKALANMKRLDPLFDAKGK
jgi:O-antigen ligase